MAKNRCENFIMLSISGGGGTESTRVLRSGD
jgi:hypothetical protein